MKMFKIIKQKHSTFAIMFWFLSLSNFRGKLKIKFCFFTNILIFGYISLNIFFFSIGPLFQLDRSDFIPYIKNKFQWNWFLRSTFAILLKGTLIWKEREIVEIIGIMEAKISNFKQVQKKSFERRVFAHIVINILLLLVLTSIFLKESLQYPLQQLRIYDFLNNLSDESLLVICTIDATLFCFLVVGYLIFQSSCLSVLSCPIAEDLNDLSQKITTQQDQLDVLMLRFAHLSQLTNQWNAAFSCPVLIWYSAAVLCFCTDIVHLFVKRIGTPIGDVILNTTLLVNCACVSQELFRVNDSFLRVRESLLGVVPKHGNSVIPFLFMATVGASEKGVSGGGFFVVTRGFVLSLVGVILTFAVVVVQFSSQ